MRTILGRADVLLLLGAIAGCHCSAVVGEEEGAAIARCR